MIQFMKNDPVVVKKKYIYEDNYIVLPEGWSIHNDWTANGFRPSICATSVDGQWAIRVRLRRNLYNEEFGQRPGQTPRNPEF